MGVDSEWAPAGNRMEEMHLQHIRIGTLAPYLVGKKNRMWTETGGSSEERREVSAEMTGCLRSRTECKAIGPNTPSTGTSVTHTPTHV